MQIACFLRAVLLPLFGLSIRIVITHFLIKDTIFGGKNFEHKMGIMVFSTIYVG